MIIDKKGKYRLLEDWQNRGSISTGTLPKGTILNISQIDEQHKRVISEELADWTRWDLPVELVNAT